MSDSHRDGPIRLGVLASGRGSNLQALLTAQDEGALRARVVVVISDRADAPALERARRHGVVAVHLDPGSERARLTAAAEDAILELLAAHEVGWVVLAGYFRIIGAKILAAYPDRLLNIHPSLLPSFPGLHAPRQALEHGVKVAGCTVHLVRDAVDQGPILAQAAVPVLGEDTEDILADRILREEHRLLVETVNRIATETIQIRGRIASWVSTA